MMNQCEKSWPWIKCFSNETFNSIRSIDIVATNHHLAHHTLISINGICNSFSKRLDRAFFLLFHGVLALWITVCDSIISDRNCFFLFWIACISECECFRKIFKIGHGTEQIRKFKWIRVLFLCFGLLCELSNGLPKATTRFGWIAVMQLITFNRMLHLLHSYPLNFLSSFVFVYVKGEKSELIL